MAFDLYRPTLDTRTIKVSAPNGSLLLPVAVHLAENWFQNPHDFALCGCAFALLFVIRKKPLVDRPQRRLIVTRHDLAAPLHPRPERPAGDVSIETASPVLTTSITRRDLTSGSSQQCQVITPLFFIHGVLKMK